MHLCPFWYESMVIGGGFRVPFVVGRFFQVPMHDPPLPPFLNGVFYLLFVGGVVDPVIRCIFL